MSCLTLQMCCLSKCKVGKCVCTLWLHLQLNNCRCVWLQILKKLYHIQYIYIFFVSAFCFLHHKPFHASLTLWKWPLTLAGGYSQQLDIHTQPCYKTFPVLIFTLLSLSLPLSNPFRESQCIKGSIKGLRDSLWWSPLNKKTIHIMPSP